GIFEALMSGSRPRLALTVGDPAGIRPEIVLAALAHREAPGAEQVVYGAREVLAKCAETLRLKPFAASGATLVDIGGDPVKPGAVSADAGRQAATPAIRAAGDAR